MSVKQYILNQKTMPSNKRQIHACKIDSIAAEDGIFKVKSPNWTAKVPTSAWI